MQGLFGRQANGGVSGPRIVVFVVVTGLHLALVMLLLRAPSSARRALPIGAKATGSVLQVRFLRHQLPKAMLPPAPAPPLLPLPRQEVTIKTPLPGASRNRKAAPATAHVAREVDTDIVATDTAVTYIAGGGFLKRASSDARPDPTHLPGSSQPIVKGLHMADPRYQGIAGAVRVAQSIVGAVNPHCVDVDVWRGMSVAEQLDRHMSPDQVEKTAEEFHCGPPP